MAHQDSTLVLTRLADQVASRATAVAVRQGDRQITYSDLDGRAGRLAQQLRSQGVERGSVVLVSLERSIELVVAMLAVFRTGATYLPVDPDVPHARVATYVKETGCVAVVTATNAARHFAGLPVRVVTGQADQPEGNPPPPAPAVTVDGSDCAYVVYTSGSSGAPKGVRVSHASLGYLLHELDQRYRIGPDDHVLQFAATSFDTSIEQILVTLLNGATLVLPDYNWAPSEFAAELVRYGVTVMDLTPPYWRAFLSELARSPVELPVRLTIVGGSAVYAEDCRTSLRLLPRSRLVNAYGLTETTITSCTMEITADVLPDRGVAPVGRPLPGTVVHVLDTDLRPVPPGERGEVYIAGPGVADGYVTEEVAGPARFLPDPVGPGAGVVYRTGDLGAWTPAGDLEVVGRVDRQIKIRGFRVEPAEIEAALTTHELIDDAAVKALDQHGEPRIVAYYTTPRRAAHRQLGSRELRAFLAEHLPEFELPSTYVELAEMPVTPNGKPDLAALPDPVFDRSSPPPSRASAGVAGAEPTSELITRAVAGIWCQVLQVDGVEPDDNFFELGGNSILAAELLAKVRATLGVLITQVRPLIRLLLQDATLRSFAAAVESARAGTLTGEGPTRADFEADTVPGVPVRRSPENPPSWQAPEHVLLTGATGFLGVYLLRELLKTTTATVHCLVRAEGPEQAEQRVRANARRYFGDDDLDPYWSRGRIRVLTGDLAQPLLGLAEEEFDRLARTVDVIHHPGGMVNFIYPYSHLRPANVEGTREIIRLAGRHRAIPIHYISTMAVVAGFGTAGVDRVTEQTPPAHVERLSVGYVESKWVAEVLLRNAAKEGVPVAIYRAADISGDCESGAWNTATEMCAMKKFIVDTGAAPIAELPMDYTPVDRYAAAVAHIAARKLPAGEVYHLTNPRKVNVSLLTERLRAHGYTVEEVSWNAWLERIVEVAVQQPGHPMTPFAPLFIDRCSTGEMSVAEMYLEDTFPAFSRDNVEAALAGSGIEIPPVDADMIDRYLRYLTSIDFL